MGDIRKLKVAEKRQPVLQPNSDLVDYIKELLQEAETGELVGFSAVMVYHNGVVVSEDLSPWEYGAEVNLEMDKLKIQIINSEMEE